ncbi:MAG: ribose-phosphate pyrophosphokinase [Dehalococcoidia bacterium]|nr:ribose-phosphate pyrophosphokinase [Dehalococcoidia bacterium]|tara:strand:+ start:21994 stop:22947 length:954 start_codon:yes stop_codon:yes gene_type:complete
MPLFEDLKVFTGNAHKPLANDICNYLGISLGDCEVFKFSNDQTFVKILENVREKDVFLIQTMSSPVNDNLMELLILIDAARRASAGRITVVIPYYAYGRTDKKDQPRVAITARLIADFITISGADRVLTMNLHAGQIQGFFNIPLDELDAIPTLANNIKERRLNKDLVVVATDVGAAKRARDMADHLDAPIAIIEKHRIGNDDKVEASNLIGNVDGKTALIVDDEIDTGGTVAAAANILKEYGANDIYCSVVHPLLSGNAVEKLRNSPMKEVLVTNTLPLSEEKQFDGLKILPIASLLGEAIHRIHTGLSVGAMFEH